VTFQSRFGKAEWLKPYTDATLKVMPSNGVTDVDVICPGFAADCLETLEEICEENKAYFLEAGGGEFHYIPALNDRDDHITALANVVTEEIGLWKVDSSEITQRETLARQCGSN
jgi:ferrochelatase